MNRVKAVSINTKNRIVKTALDFHAATDLDRAVKKEVVHSANVRTSIEQDLDLVVGRSIN
jgi:hypothetical protein